MDGYTGVHVTSEIGPLRKVLLHRPGDELLNLTPGTLRELLFDDIPYLRAARAEHDAFAAVLRSEGVHVVYLEQLMAQVLEARPHLREKFLQQWIFEAGIRTARYQRILLDFMNEHYPQPLACVLKTMAGVNLQELPHQKADSLVDLVSDASKLVCRPMPNLYFTRDPFAIIGEGVAINRMHSAVRGRETIYAEYIFAHHPDFKAVPHYYERANTFHIEGGDVLNLSPRVVAVGISERTEADAIDQLARNLFASAAAGRCKVERVLAFQIPARRAFMHLDTVFTQVDYDAFTFHPGILGALRVFEIVPAKWGPAVGARGGWSGVGGAGGGAGAGGGGRAASGAQGSGGEGLRAGSGAQGGAGAEAGPGAGPGEGGAGAAAGEDGASAAAASGASVRIRQLDMPLELVLSGVVGGPVRMIACGAGDRIAAEREQWNDGSNTLCVRPGTVVVYNRNTVTNEALDRAGVNVLEIASGELSRGRGGPRCMSMPLWRA